MPLRDSFRVLLYNKINLQLKQSTGACLVVIYLSMQKSKFLFFLIWQNVNKGKNILQNKLNVHLLNMMEKPVDHNALHLHHASFLFLKELINPKSVSENIVVSIACSSCVWWPTVQVLTFGLLFITRELMQQSVICLLDNKPRSLGSICFW